MATLELISLDSCDPLELPTVATKAGLTMREVSSLARSRTDLLKLAMSEVARRYIHRLENRDNGLSGVVGAMTGVMRYMPVTDAERAEWKVWIFFWGAAVEVPQLAAILRLAEEEMSTRLARILSNGLGGSPDYPWKDLALRVVTVTHGVALRATLDPLAWPEERQRALLESLLVPHFKAAVESGAPRPGVAGQMPSPRRMVRPRSIDLRDTEATPAD